MAKEAKNVVIHHNYDHLEPDSSDFTNLGADNSGKKKGRPFGTRKTASTPPEAVGTFVSGSILGCILRFAPNKYYMVIPNVDFPSCVEMDINTAAMRLNLCETRVFDADLSKAMRQMAETQPNLFNLPNNPETAS